jgi:S1-C subfamily serine protease
MEIEDTTEMSITMLAELSRAAAAHVAAAAPSIVAIRRDSRQHVTGILWQPGVVVTSEQLLPDQADYAVVLPGGAEAVAHPAGRDPGTNLALLRIEDAACAPPRLSPATPDVGGFTLVLGSDGTGGPTARLGLVHLTGPEWHSLAGGRIDALLRLDVRLGVDEGGPVLDAEGGLLGMSTTGPRRRALVIPAATIARVIGPLLADGRIARGWLGIGLQPVMVPEAHRREDCPAGMLVVSLAAGGPAEQAGVLPGDILLELDGHPAARPRALAELMAPDRVGLTVVLRLLRAGQVRTMDAVIAARPAG